MTSLFKGILRTASSLIIVLFGVNATVLPASYAQVAFLPAAGSMVPLTAKFDPLMIKGVKLFPDNPFKFEFIVDTGDLNLSQEEIKEEGQKLASYFLAALTTPEKEMWVNLSPYEKSRIIPKSFGDTELGKEVLGQDYILKQLMATALYPEGKLGKEFWQRVYKEAAEKFGTTNVPISTFNKVWIVPNDAIVYENEQVNAVFVVKSSLKVMLEKDYLAANRHKAAEQFGMTDLPSADPSEAANISTNVIKEVVIPALEREVNEGKNFAKLRQAYQGLILAAWYKKNMKESLLSKGYVDKGKTLGVDTKDKQINQKIYQQYLKAYKKGAYNFIKEEVDPATQQVIPRKYFSGGFNAAMLALKMREVKSNSPAVIELNTGMNRLLEQARILILPMVTVLSLGGTFLANNEAPGTLSGFTAASPHQIVSANTANNDNNRLQIVAGTATVSSHINDELQTPILDTANAKIAQITTVNIAKPQLAASSNEVIQTLKVAAKSPYATPEMQQINRGTPLSPSPQEPPLQLLLALLYAIRDSIGSWSGSGSGSAPPAPPDDPKSFADLAKVIRLSVVNNPAYTITSLGTLSLGASSAAMITNDDDKQNDLGGIDLERINVMIKSEGKIRTAFGDQKILQMLQKANGLLPQMQNIRPMDALMMNMYLGLNQDAVKDIKKAAGISKESNTVIL